MPFDFNYIPSYSSSTSVAPRVNVVQFGDGYSQRAADGINIQKTTWNLVFTNLVDSDAVAIDALLKQAAGDTLKWKPAPALETDPYRYWSCAEWSITKNNYNGQSLNCKFEEVFNIV